MQSGSSEIINYHFSDFTEANYRRLLNVAKARFDFLFYGEKKSKGRNILWRHDVDHTLERSLRLAQIESEEGVKSTYFLYLHAETYSVLERESVKQVEEILSLGHRIGLHFDLPFYQPKSTAEVMKLLELEKQILETTFKVGVEALSFHFPQFGGELIDLRQESFLGMVNAYAQSIFDSYEYVSDSNGYWRFKRLEDVLRTSNADLHVLTHPVYWVPNVMSPRDRIQLCIDKRATRMGEIYDDWTHASGRLNVK